MTRIPGPVNRHSGIADNSVTLEKLEDGTQGDILYYAANGAPTRLSAGSDGQVLQTQGAGANPQWAASGILGTEQATTSGTEVDFTSIPSWVNRITVELEGVSTNGTTALRILLGDSGGFEASGYTGIADGPTAANHGAAFFITTSHAAAGTYDGFCELALKDSTNNTWMLMGIVGRSDSTAQVATKSVGAKSLSGTLTQIRIQADGVDVFDAGSVNILYS